MDRGTNFEAILRSGVRKKAALGMHLGSIHSHGLLRSAVLTCTEVTWQAWQEVVSETTYLPEV